MNKRINFTVPEEIIDALRVASKEAGLSQSAYVSMSIKNQMDRDKLMRELPAFTDALQKAVTIAGAQAGERRP